MVWLHSRQQQLSTNLCCYHMLCLAICLQTLTFHLTTKFVSQIFNICIGHSVSLCGDWPFVLHSWLHIYIFLLVSIRTVFCPSVGSNYLVLLLLCCIDCHLRGGKRKKILDKRYGKSKKGSSSLISGETEIEVTISGTLWASAEQSTTSIWSSELKQLVLLRPVLEDRDIMIKTKERSWKSLCSWLSMPAFPGLFHLHGKTRHAAVSRVASEQPCVFCRMQRWGCFLDFRIKTVLLH